MAAGIAEAQGPKAPRNAAPALHGHNFAIIPARGPPRPAPLFSKSGMRRNRVLMDIDLSRGPNSLCRKRHCAYSLGCMALAVLCLEICV